MYYIIWVMKEHNALLNGLDKPGQQRRAYYQLCHHDLLCRMNIINAFMRLDPNIKPGDGDNVLRRITYRGFPQPGNVNNLFFPGGGI